MSFWPHLKTFAGLPVKEYEIGKPIQSPKTTAYRIRAESSWSDPDIQFGHKLKPFLDDPNAPQVHAFVVGAWDNVREEGGPEGAVEQLVGARHILKNLKTMFFGDIIYTENEISWLHQGDLSALFLAFEKLEEFWVRGGNGLRLGHIQHKRLKKLVVQTGGMSGDLIEPLLHSQLPSLTHLELWLGHPNYGCSVTMQDLQPLLSGKYFPKLKYLGLNNLGVARDFAQEIAKSKIIGRLNVLDMSKSSLNDAEAETLLKITNLKKLKTFDLSENYLSDNLIKQFKKAGIKIQADGQREVEDEDYDEHYRFCVVGE